MKIIPMAWKKPNKELTEFLEEKMASFDCQKKIMKKKSRFKDNVRD